MVYIAPKLGLEGGRGGGREDVQVYAQSRSCSSTELTVVRCAGQSLAKKTFFDSLVSIQHPAKKLAGFSVKIFLLVFNQFQTLALVKEPGISLCIPC